MNHSLINRQRAYSIMTPHRFLLVDDWGMYECLFLIHIKLQEQIFSGKKYIYTCFICLLAKSDHHSLDFLRSQVFLFCFIFIYCGFKAANNCRIWPHRKLLCFWSVKSPRPESFSKRRIIKKLNTIFFSLIYCAGFGQDDKYLARFPSIVRNLLQISVEYWLQHPNGEKRKPVIVSLLLFQAIIIFKNENNC